MKVPARLPLKHWRVLYLFTMTGQLLSYTRYVTVEALFWAALSLPSSDNESRILDEGLLLLGLDSLREYFPKSEGLVASTRHDRLAVRAHC